MKIFHLLFAVVLSATMHLSAQQVRYDLSFPNAVHHEAEIAITFLNLPAKPLEVHMSRSSPGRYALHEFAKNVYNVKAFDKNGTELQLTHPTPHKWVIAQHEGYVVVKYTLFADHADGTYSGIDDSHAHLCMPATLMWGVGLDTAAITLHFTIPKDHDWAIATQLFPTDDRTTFTSPGLQYMMDSPTELSNFTIRDWTVAGGHGVYPIRMAVHHDGTDEQVNTFVEMAKRIVVEEKAVFGELPKYDVGSYMFIADYMPYIHGDGMEHRNSTTIMSTRPLKTNVVDHLGTLAHEYFHSWNVERIRPKSLEPFNFDEANMSGELWFAEGFTNYYGGLMMARAGMISEDRYAKNISGALNSVINGSGRKYFSPVEMSEQAPFVDAATSNDEQNKRNTFISYYSYGEVIALGLDLTLRTKFRNLTLDDFMREVWHRHGATEIPYTNEDLRNILGSVTGNQSFADSVFREIIYGHDLFDFERLLTFAGFKLRKSKENKASLGDEGIRFDDGKAIVTTPSTVNGPLYMAGVDRTDRILSIDKMNITSGKDIDSVLAKHTPGDKVEIEFERRGEKKSSFVTFEKDRKIEAVPFETALISLTDETALFRQKWIGSQASEKMPELSKICKTCKRSFPFQFEFCHFDGDTLKIFLEK